MKRVLMAAGGTGGHIFPALAVAEELCRRTKGPAPAYEVEFLGTKRGLENRVLPRAGFALRTVRAAGLKGVGGWKKLLNLFVLPQSAVETAMVLREFQPDVVVGMGGYLAGPAMLEAALEDVPTVLIEPNAVPGFTNRLLAPVVRRAAVAYEETADYFGAKASLTGAPVRNAFFNVTAKEHLPPFTVLVLGGSQGSRAINQSVIETVKHLASGRIGCHLVHQTGERDYAAVQEAYREQGVEADVFPFIDDVPRALARADLVISRAGAISVAELAAAGKASLLVPFPLATDQHQRENARVFERAGAARVIDQHELTPERLAEEICGLLAQPEPLKRMEKAAKTLARPDAVERIADMIEELAG